MVAGQFKEILTIIFFTIVYDTPFTWLNGLGLVVLMSGLVMFNYSKYEKLKRGASEAAEIEQSRGGPEGWGGDRLALLQADGHSEILADEMGPRSNGHVMLELLEHRAE
jgi:hypothetical protein